MMKLAALTEKLNITLSKPPAAAGLDIGSAAVKMVRLEPSFSGFRAVDAVCIPYASETENQLSEKAAAAAVQKCIKNIPRHSFVCAVSGPEVILRPFRFPSLPGKALEQAVRLEAQQVCPFDIENSVVEYQVLGKSSSAEEPKCEGIFVAATNSLIRAKTALLDKAGGKTMLMDVEGLAALNCLCRCTKNENEAAGLINIGNRLTNVVILGENGFPFIRDLSYAGRNLISAVQQQTNLQESRLQKILFSGAAPTGTESFVFSALTQAAARLVADLNETVRYFLSQNTGSRLNKLYLTGGWALSAPFAELIKRALPVKVEIFNPFDMIDVPHELETQLKQTGPMFTIAAGLAMRGAENEI